MMLAQEHTRRSFLHKAAATTAILTATGFATGIGTSQEGGSCGGSGDPGGGPCNGYYGPDGYPCDPTTCDCSDGGDDGQ